MPNRTVQRMRRNLGRVGSGPLLAGALALFGAFAAGCETNAATGESRLMLGYMSPQQQVALGEQAMPQLTEEYGGATPSPALQGYVTEVGAKMAAKTEADNPSLPWEFTLLDSPVINAFALPGGKVFISRGLAAKLTNEAQLAGVLGHEIGHVTAEHIAERVQTQTGTALFGQLLSAAAGLGDSTALQQLTDTIVGYGGQGYLLHFGRDQELEADKLGMRYMSRVGYDPVAQRQVMQILAAESQGARPPEFLSTHPYPENRIKQIDELLATQYADITGHPGYGLYESRYKQRFLVPESKLPAMKSQASADDSVVAYCSVCGAPLVVHEHE
ncbi:MAG: M48 family metallopeptidase [Phycisphaeraceae bacterium]|nr:MAG: M48 family metallopeptidase [Phycisphaeraceae bacterium]